MALAPAGQRCALEQVVIDFDHNLAQPCTGIKRTHRAV
jgi:hypothetical protein